MNEKDKRDKINRDLSLLSKSAVAGAKRTNGRANGSRQPLNRKPNLRTTIPNPESIMYRWWVLFVLTQSSFATDHPLQLAWRIAQEQYSGWTYGKRGDQTQVDCVTFLENVLEQLLQRPLRSQERARIMIQNIKPQDDLQALVERGERRTRGIQHALVSMRRGKVIQPPDARPGDFIQYWYKRDSLWVGHAALIQEVRREGDFYCSFTFGAHESLNGVGVAGYMVTLNDPHMKVYIVRFR
jgi:hypothetical protein